MTLKTPKKHKQRFEHFSCVEEDFEGVMNRIDKREAEGYELINIIFHPGIDYNLFFKRPV